MDELKEWLESRHAKLADIHRDKHGVLWVMQDRDGYKVPDVFQAWQKQRKQEAEATPTNS